MATIIKHSDLVSRALSYIDERLAAEPNCDRHAMVDDAAMRFNLSPADAESLLHILASDTQKE